MLRFYTTTAAENPTAQPMRSSPGGLTPVLTKPAKGYIAHILVTGTDASADVTILDDLGNIFAQTGIVANTANGIHYKHDNAAIIRNAIQGTLYVTIANNAAIVNVYVFFRPWDDR